MTGEGVRGRMRVGLSRAASSIMPTVWLILMLGFAVFLSRRAADYALGGMITAVSCVLPTAFPSMLFCDLYRAYGKPERITPLGLAIGVLLGLPPESLRALLLGNLCGFPMGARETLALYESGVLEREEAERLLPLTMNPSPPFVAGAVGIAMLGGVREGVALLSCLAVSTLAVGVIFRGRGKRRKISGFAIENRYNFVESVKGAAESSLTVIAFITCFSVVLGFVRDFVKPYAIRAAAFAFIEVTGGVQFFAKAYSLSPELRGALVAFTLGFGGISVMLQGAAFVKGRLALKGYAFVKFWQGFICAVCYYFVAGRFL